MLITLSDESNIHVQILYNKTLKKIETTWVFEFNDN